MEKIAMIGMSKEQFLRLFSATKISTNVACSKQEVSDFNAATRIDEDLECLMPAFQSGKNIGINSAEQIIWLACCEAGRG